MYVLPVPAYFRTILEDILLERLLGTYLLRNRDIEQVLEIQQ